MKPVLTSLCRWIGLGGHLIQGYDLTSIYNLHPASATEPLYGENVSISKLTPLTILLYLCIWNIRNTNAIMFRLKVGNFTPPPPHFPEKKSVITYLLPEKWC